MKHLMMVSLGLAMVLAAPVAGADLVEHYVEFGTDAAGNTIVAGQVIDEEYADWGLHISVDNPNRRGDFGVAFDTQNWTGGDQDLAPIYDGGNLPLDTDLGNVLIIQESGYNNNGFLAGGVPDDEQRGGSIYFNFDMFVTQFGFDLVDIEGINAEANYYAEFYRGSDLIEQISFNDLTTPGNAYYDSSLVWGDNTINRIEPFVVNEGNGFDQVVIHFGGSGAVDNVRFAVVPEPATMILLGGGLAAMAVRYRRKRLAK